ncbi:MAG: CoB--CoM heterodisulfide reductase iron-sulfur subunit A family protein [Candidatus Krumholzibacteriota bacterium]|nr:CoB--CoM heterodisulfide reductase iron-sulfur subunit A family protein [Candidatus Krumholzibacteriota bacterium]
MSRKGSGELRSGGSGGNGGPRVGVYICHCGGNISDVVAVEHVVEAVRKLPCVVIARRHMFMCSDPGQNLVLEDVVNEKLDRVVVAACSPTLHELTFRDTLRRAGLNPYLYEHANIREQVSWASKSDPEGATDKAIRLVAAAVAKACRLRPLEPLRVGASRRVAVIGGGIAGLRSALDLASQGLAVALLERSPFFGGRAAQLDQVFPTSDRASDLLAELMAKASVDPNISLYTGAEVASTSGYIGNFHMKVTLHPRGVREGITPDQARAAIEACPETAASEFDYGLARRKAIYQPCPDCHPPLPAIDWETCTRCGKCAEAAGEGAIALEAPAREIDLDVGAIVLATGFDPYEPRTGEYGYGEHGVVTLPQFIRMLNERGPTAGRLTVDGRPVRNIAFIHCVGSRQVDGIHAPGPDGKVNDYCSRVCCTATLQAAKEVRDRFPDVNVFDFYQDIRTYGRGHETYYEDTSKQGVLFFRWTADAPPVVEAATGDPDAALVVKVKDTLTWGEEVEVPADLVVLSTGIMPRDIGSLVEMLKLPRGADRFLQEVHPKLRPVELAVGGVFLAGTCQGPMDITESAAAASAAAVKASALLAKGHIELDPFVAGVDEALCTGGVGCNSVCVEECGAQHAISLVERREGGETRLVAEVNRAVCGGCGMCVAVCPSRAIQVEGWRLDQFESMVDALLTVEG